MARIEFDLASPPGDTLLDLLKERGIKQSTLARATGLSTKHINQIIKGKARIGVKTALLLERELQTPARFWLHRQANYDLAIARKEQTNANA